MPMRRKIAVKQTNKTKNKHKTKQKQEKPPLFLLLFLFRDQFKVASQDTPPSLKRAYFPLIHAFLVIFSSFVEFTSDLCIVRISVIYTYVFFL